MRKIFNKHNNKNPMPAPTRPAPKTSAKPVSQKTPIGRTIKTKDEYLPYDPKKVIELKDKRWIAVIDKNDFEELAVVRLTDEDQPNTSPLPTYKKGNKGDTYFKHFIEIEDNVGNPIKVDNQRFIENHKKYDLRAEEIKEIQNKVLHRVKQSDANRKKIAKLRNK